MQPAFNVFIDGTLSAGSLAPGQGVDVSLPAGSHNVSVGDLSCLAVDGGGVCTAGVNIGLPNLPFTLAGGTTTIDGSATMAVNEVGGYANGLFTVFQNDVSATAHNEVRITLNNGNEYPGAPSFDLCVGGTKVLSGVAPGASGYVEIPEALGASLGVAPTNPGCATVATVNFAAGTNFVLTLVPVACSAGCAQTLFVGQTPVPNVPDAPTFCYALLTLNGTGAALGTLFANVDPYNPGTYPSTGDVHAWTDSAEALFDQGDASAPTDIFDAWRVVTAPPTGLGNLTTALKLVNYNLASFPTDVVAQIVDGVNGNGPNQAANDAAAATLNTWFGLNCVTGAVENVAQVPSAVGAAPVTVASQPGTTLTNVVSAPVPTGPTDPTPPQDASFPVGVLSFEVDNVPSGGQPVTVQVQLPPGTPPTVYYKLLHNPDRYVDASSIVERSGDVLTLSLVDGGPFDDDGTADGVIHDPLLVTAPFGDSHVVTALGPLHAWIGLKSSDDQGTRFDVRTELLVNGAPVASGVTRCVVGVTRNSAAALEAVVSFKEFVPVFLEDTDVLAVRVSARIGTNPNDTFCGGHNNAKGLRLYYDSAARHSRIDATIVPAENAEEFFHSDGTACANAPSANVTTKTTDDIAPIASLAQVKCRDSGAVKFAGGNMWQTVDTWTLPALVTEAS